MTSPEGGRRRRLVAVGYVLAVTAFGVVAWYPGLSEAWAYILVLVLCAPLTAITYPLFFLVVGLTVRPPDDGPWIFYVAWWAVVAVVQALVVVRFLDRRGQKVPTSGR